MLGFATTLPNLHINKRDEHNMGCRITDILNHRALALKPTTRDKLLVLANLNVALHSRLNDSTRRS